MSSKKAILESVLLKELIAIRTDTLWRMLFLFQQGQLPNINEEGATDKLDNKGAIFIPGGLIYQDVDEKQISYEPFGTLNEASFREKIRASMRYDNATLMFPDGLAKSINLDSGFFARAARRIYTLKTAAFKRKRKIGPRSLSILIPTTLSAVTARATWIHLTALEHESARVSPSL
jgi:hypothetical protein